jgi:metal-responsive CopG/Arc/MetJ family transcriptional regulator
MFGYTTGMKTAISIANHVYEDAERLARRTNKSRSQLYTEAVAEYVARHDSEAITETMNRVCEKLDTQLHPALSAAARRVLQRTEW